MSFSSIKKHFSGTSARIAALVGLLMYLSYGVGFDSLVRPALIGVAAFIGLALPAYSRTSNRIEQKANSYLALVTVGRLARFVTQLAFNLSAFSLLWWGQVIPTANFAGVGGLIGAAALTTAASQGAQYLAIMLANRNVGDLNRNVMLALTVNIVVTAAAIMGFDVARAVFVVGGILLALFVFGGGILSDVRARLYPKRGIGVFFGTFNPFHSTHLDLVRRALSERRLEKVIIHPTVIPRLHRVGLEKGEIRVNHIEGGMQVYETTAKADPYIDYFATGNRFFAPETRLRLIEVAIDEAGLSDKVETLFLPEVYARDGFHGVLRAVRKKYPGAPIHGIHGSDVGGMLVRAILDECGWVYPMPTLRRDGISATAIRNGAKGMTPLSVEVVLGHLRSGKREIMINQRRFRNDNGVLSPA